MTASSLPAGAWARPAGGYATLRTSPGTSIHPISTTSMDANAADGGEPVGRIAASLRVGVSYVSKVLSRRRRTGVTTAVAPRGHVRPKLIDHHDAIRTRIAAKPDATIEELKAWLHATHQVTASAGVVWKTLSTLKRTLKKVTPGGRAGPSRRCQSPRDVARTAAKPDTGPLGFH